MSNRLAQNFVTRYCLWAIAGLVGLLQTIAHRFYIEPDGVNYLDVAYAYLRHDFQNAINAYWSPLYSWLLAFAIALSHASTYWESTILHFLNFLIYLLSLTCFAFFFRGLTALASEEVGLPEKRPLALLAWNLFGYSLFVYASIELVRLDTDTPDMLVAAACFLATGILVRIRNGVVTKGFFHFSLGVVLALGYIAKAVMFPISLVFLLSSFFVSGNWRQAVPRTALAFASFLLFASPWLLTLSNAKGRFTFGETGRLNYAWYVHGTGTRLHPVRLLCTNPPVEEFATPVAGTYPPWYDPSYWNEGLRPQFEWHRQLRALGMNLGEYFRMFSAQKGIAVGLLVLILLSGRLGRYLRLFLKLWPIWLPSAATMGLYVLVHVESRFLGAAIVVLWCTLFAAVRLPRSEFFERAKASCLIAVSAALGVTLTAQIANDLYAIIKGQQNVEYQVAHELTLWGINKGDSVAVLGHSNNGDYWAHLKQVRIVADIPMEGVSTFWDADSQARRHVFEVLARSGARALVTRILPPPSQSVDWHPLGSTGVYLILLPSS